MSLDVLLAFLGISMLGLTVAAQNWRLAFLMVVIVGFAQDPLRKMTPGEPVVMVMLSSAMVALATLFASAKLGMINLKPLTQGNRTAQKVLRAFVALVFAQSLFSFVRYNSLVIPAIGMIAYLSPIPAIWLAFRYLRGVSDLRNFVRVYVACAVVLAISILLDQAGVDSILLKEVGEGLVIYDIRVGLLQAYTGIARSPEVAAWHLGTASCLLIILAVSFKGGVMKWLAPSLVIVLMVIATLTGRRKVLVVVAAFIVVYFLLLGYFKQRSARRSLFISIVSGIVLAAGSLVMAPDQSTMNPYVGRGASVFADISERFQVLGIESMYWAIQSAGFFGVGAGAASQGAQHFSGASESIRFSAEGGLGKIIVELGVAGLILIVLSIAMIARSTRRALAVTARSGNVQILRMNLGLFAYCAANIPVFIGASQIYGDPFVLFILGSSMGFVLAGPRLVELHARRASNADAEARSLGLPARAQALQRVV